MWKLIDFALTPDQDLLSLINVDNGTNLALADVKFSLPVSVPPDVDGRNTRVTVTSLNRRKYVGFKDVFYARIPFTEFGPIELLLEEPFTQASLLAVLNGEKNVVLTPNDINNYSFLNTLKIGEVKNIILTANPNSLRWVGSAPAEICFGLPPSIVALHHLINDTLPTPGYLP